MFSRVKLRNSMLMPRSPRSMSCWQPGHGMVVTRGVTEPRRHPGDEMEPGGERRRYSKHGGPIYLDFQTTFALWLQAMNREVSLSMDGEGTLDLGLPGREHSEPASKESSWFSISSSLIHLWQTLCWQGRISGWAAGAGRRTRATGRRLTSPRSIRSTMLANSVMSSESDMATDGGGWCSTKPGQPTGGSHT
ncbi:hypothetical protein EYF80_033859 [Liparis tanakae]|uniref:Uncharacterized protein n=1 Tax=Liparis tanakae TaxID=230148 RepID=A0A4Z2GT04_9TELE|nr:hypothetical protein EYF80_033859 [Liparis tanakae]